MSMKVVNAVMAVLVCALALACCALAIRNSDAQQAQAATPFEEASAEAWKECAVHYRYPRCPGSYSASYEDVCNPDDGKREIITVYRCKNGWLRADVPEPWSKPEPPQLKAPGKAK